MPVIFAAWGSTALKAGTILPWKSVRPRKTSRNQRVTTSHWAQWAIHKRRLKLYRTNKLHVWKGTMRATYAPIHMMHFQGFTGKTKLICTLQLLQQVLNWLFAVELQSPKHLAHHETKKEEAPSPVEQLQSSIRQELPGVYGLQRGMLHSREHYLIYVAAIKFSLVKYLSVNNHINPWQLLYCTALLHQRRLCCCVQFVNFISNFPLT